MTDLLAPPASAHHSCCFPVAEGLPVLQPQPQVRQGPVSGLGGVGHCPFLHLQPLVPTGLGSPGCCTYWCLPSSFEPPGANCFGGCCCPMLALDMTPPAPLDCCLKHLLVLALLVASACSVVLGPARSGGLGCCCSFSLILGLLSAHNAAPAPLCPGKALLWHLELLLCICICAGASACMCIFASKLCLCVDEGICMLV